jgi:hypothetical protein
MPETVLKKLLVVLALCFLAQRVGYAQVSDDCLGTCSANAAVVCLADADCGTGDTCALPTPACTLPAPLDASWTGSDADDHRDIDPTCPRPTVSQGSLCVLKDDVDLAAIGTINLASNTHLNCLGHKIYTSTPGVNVNIRSMPEIALHLAGAFGVKIQNCVIDGFDFPILAHDIKLPADVASDPGSLEQLADRIDGNTINGAFVSIELVNVDNMRIEDNTITNSWGNGFGVLVLRTSKINQILNNTFTRPNSALAPVVFLPGPSSTWNPTSSNLGLGIFLTQGTNMPNLINMIIGGTLYQYPNAVPVFEADGTTVTNGGDFMSDNVVEGNTLGPCAIVGCIGNSNALRSVMVGNQMSNVGPGTGFDWGSLNLTGPFPGTCSLNPARPCLTNTDCKIPGYDVSSQGICSGVRSYSVASISNGGVIINNTIKGPLNVGLSLTTLGILAQGNTVTGPVLPGTDFTSAGGVGIELRKNGTRNAIVTQNVISNVPAAIRVFNINGNVFGAQISLNDFTGYYDEAFVFSGYNIPSELSVGLQGNYWGLPCSPTGGGGFNPSKVLVLSSGKVASDGTVSTIGTVNMFVHDSHPYGVSVATTDPSLLPTTLSGGYCSASP